VNRRLETGPALLAGGNPARKPQGGHWDDVWIPVRGFDPTDSI